MSMGVTDMREKQSSKRKSDSTYERENEQAEALVKELESPMGAQRLGDEAYEIAMKDLKEKCHAHKCS